MGNFATSYIKTTTSSATRVADACFKTGISSLINSNTGTFYYDGIVNTADYISLNGVFLEVIGSSTANTFVFYMDFSNGYIKLFQNPFATSVTLKSENFRNQRFKMAFAYANADFVCYINGVQTFATPSIPLASGLANVYLNTNRSFSENAMSVVNETIIFPTRLTNAELASLTTI